MKKKLKILFWSGMLLIVIGSIAGFVINHKIEEVERENRNYLSCCKKIKNYSIQIEEFYDKNVLKINGNINIENEKRNFTFKKISSQNTDIENEILYTYYFDYETYNVDYYSIYNGEKLASSNIITGNENIYNLDVTRIYSSLVMLLENSMYCSKNSCIYTLTDFDKNYFASLLSLITYGNFDSIFDNNNIVLTLQIDENNSLIEKALFDISDNYKIKLAFNNFVYQ